MQYVLIQYTNPYLANLIIGLFVPICRLCNGLTIVLARPWRTWCRHEMEAFSALLVLLLCGEFAGHRWTPRTKASNAQLWCFLWSVPWINGWVNNREAGDLRHHGAHYDIVVMIYDVHGGTFHWMKTYGSRQNLRVTCIWYLMINKSALVWMTQCSGVFNQTDISCWQLIIMIHLLYIKLLFFLLLNLNNDYRKSMHQVKR